MTAYSRKRKAPFGARFAPQRARKTYRSSKYTPTTARISLGQTSLNENKTIDVDPATYAFDTTGSITLLSGVATGADFTDRIGRKIFMKSLYIRGIIKPVDNNVGNTLARMIIVYDMQPNGAAPGITDILKSSSPASQLNLNNRDRFRILIDKQWSIGAVSDASTSSLSGSPTVHTLKKFKRLNLEEVFKGTTSAITDISTGSIYMITLGDQAVGNGAVVSMSSRVRFMDA